MLAESAGNPRAVSPSGAMGLFQIMPGTWSELSAELGLHDPFNPDDSIRAGTHYDAKILANLKIKFGVAAASDDDYYRFMLASYNAGPGYVIEALKECRARSLPTRWDHFASLFPSATVRGRKPDSKQALSYVLKILPVVSDGGP